MIGDTTDTQYPRAIAVINNSYRLPMISVEVEHNSFFQADTFRIKAPMGALKTYDPQWWSRQNELQVAIYMGYVTDPAHFSEGNLTPRLLGEADQVEMEWDSQELRITGRDLTARLIDAGSEQTWMNLTADKVVSAIAKKYGMTASVQTPPNAEAIGNFLGSDWTHLEHRSAWDLLTYLANNTVSNKDHWVCYVKWNTLYFGPRPSTQATTIRWPWDVQTLRTLRNMVVSKDITVEIEGWNAQTGTVIVGSVSSSGHTAIGRTYIYVEPGISPSEAIKKAQTKIAQLISHELSAHITMPGNTALDMLHKIQITGTGTDWDTTLFPNNIRHRLTVEDGYSCDVVAKSHAPTTLIGTATTRANALNAQVTIP